MSSGGSEAHRAIILTAISVEYQAVRDHLTQLREEIQSGTVYEKGNFATSSQSWDVIIMEIGIGNVQAALETERAINFFNPSVILLVGIAGGLKNVKCGDVVVATKVYAYESGKAEGQTFQARPEVSSPTYRLVRLARTEARKKDWLRRLKEPVTDPIPRVFAAPIASGGSVIASTQSTAYELLRSNYNDAVAVDRRDLDFSTLLEIIRK
jgi:nucleoside phosphorylase